VRPLTVLTGIVLGSSAATTFGHPRFRSELPLLATYLAIFVGLTALAGVSFVGLARNRPWRRWAQVAMWSALAALAAVYGYTRG
jgi:hypothetical protein